MNDFQRYERQLLTIGLAGQTALKNAKVLCIGAGGLGVIVVSYLVGAGVGVIDIIDGDTVSVSNLTRQIMYSEEAVGKYKVDELKKRLVDLNSECQINVFNNFFERNSKYNITNKYSLVLDCSDNYKTRYLISDLCSESSVPLISASVDGFYGQVLLLLSNICYRCIFPQHSPNANNCQNGNVIGSSVGIIASYQANEALKFLVGINRINKLINVDMLNNKISNYQIQADYDCINEHLQNIDDVPDVQFMDIKEIIQLSHTQEIFILDLSAHKHNLNLNTQTDVLELVNDIKLDHPIAVVCTSGYKAKLVALQLHSSGYTKVYYTRKMNYT